jgi:hypothetical protein
MGRCKTCGCDLGPCITTHISLSCLPLLRQCCECGEEDKATNMKVCGVCDADLCESCFDNHGRECEEENGQFGVGA